MLRFTCLMGTIVNVFDWHWKQHACMHALCSKVNLILLNTGEFEHRAFLGKCSTTENWAKHVLLLFWHLRHNLTGCLGWLLTSYVSYLCLETMRLFLLSSNNIGQQYWAVSISHTHHHPWSHYLRRFNSGTMPFIMKICSSSHKKLPFIFTLL